MNYIDYDKKIAQAELETIGYKSYPNKHGESRFTRYFQDHFLPCKFGFDKRKPHLSSLILSKQMSRTEALMKIKEPLYENNIDLQIDRKFIADKLEITLDELLVYEKSTNKYATDYKNQKYIINLVNFTKLVSKALNLKIKSYT